ncbi:MAG: hypothetical protein ABI240_07305 [Sphingomonas sp.]
MGSRELIVLIVRSDALRSALIARLSLQGESLMTLDVNPQDPVLDRIARAPKILVLDSESLGDQLPSLLDGGQWEHIIILADRARASSSNQVCTIDRREAHIEVGRELALRRLPVPVPA